MEAKKMRDVCRELGIHENTVRNLERKGLIHPTRNLVGHRIFTDDVVQKIREIYQGQNASR